MTLTGRAAGLALAGSLLVGLLLPGWGGILLVEGALATAVVVDLLLAGSVRGLTMTRGGDETVRLGEVASVTLDVVNAGGRRVRGPLRDAWPPSAGAQPDRHRLDVPPGGRQRLTTVLRPTRRGDRRAVTVAVRAVGPLGLAARQGRHAVPWTVRVLPAFASRRHLPARLARLHTLDGRAAARVRGRGTEFDSLREYTIGDDVRSIDWRASARAADVMVRTWRPERDRHVLVVLDTGRTSAGRVGDAPRLDAAMDASLLLAALASRAGDRVDLLAYDRGVRASVQRAAPAELLAQMVDAMAPLEPALVETDVPGLAAEIHRRTRGGHRSLVVLTTAIDAAAAEEGLLAALPRLTRRHLLLVASVADPRVEELAGGRGRAGAVYAAASAERARWERGQVTTRLRRAGALVVDAPPERLAPALADAYLALKAGGRL